MENFGGEEDGGVGEAERVDGLKKDEVEDRRGEAEN